MTLVLTITNVDGLENGMSTRLRLVRHGAVIGRLPTADWSLPDSKNYISSIHCEVEFENGAYTLSDNSMNGTVVNGVRMSKGDTRVIKDGDRITIGHYEIVASLEGEAAAPAQQGGPIAAGRSPFAPFAEADPIAPADSSWGPAPPAPPVRSDALGNAFAPPPIAPGLTPPASGGGWATPPVASPPAASGGVWAAPTQEDLAPSGWSDAHSNAKPPLSAAQIFGRLASDNKVDWGRAGFDQPAAPPPARDPFSPPPPATSEAAVFAPAQRPLGPQNDIFGLPIEGASPSPPPPATPSASPAFLATGPEVRLPDAPPPFARVPGPAAQDPLLPPERRPDVQPTPPPTPSAAAPPGDWTAFLQGAGLQPADIKVAPDVAMTTAGLMLRRMVMGLVVMLEARAKAKAQLGAAGTEFRPGSTNSLKFARSPEGALIQLLNPRERDFLPPSEAVEDAFKDLQAHQMATLAAMQGALAATLARFSPAAIRERAAARGLARLLPGRGEARLWRLYEKEFEGVVEGSDEAFMDVFAKEFKSAYEEAAESMRRR